VCAVFFYGAGQKEAAPAAAWAALSVLFSTFVMVFTPWRMWGILASQVLLFVGIALFRLWREGDAPIK
jgi:hypothetical protein